MNMYTISTWDYDDGTHILLLLHKENFSKKKFMKTYLEVLKESIVSILTEGKYPRLVNFQKLVHSEQVLKCFAQRGFTPPVIRASADCCYGGVYLIPDINDPFEYDEYKLENQCHPDQVKIIEELRRHLAIKGLYPCPTST